MKKILLVLIILLCGCSNDNKQHVGTWKSLPYGLQMNEVKSFILTMDNQGHLTILDGTDLSKIDIRYEIDYTQNPIWLDLIFSNKESKEEIERLLWIVRFPSKNKMEIRTNNVRERYLEFNSKDNENTVYFDRVSLEKNIKEIKDKSKEVKEKRIFPYYKTDLEKMKLRGKVKSLREYSYKPIDNFGKISKGERLFNDGFDYLNDKTPYQFSIPNGGLLTFNKNGLFKELIEYDKNNKILKNVIFKYNQKGYKIEENEYVLNNIFGGKTVLRYNEKGFLIDRSYYDKDGKMWRKFVFDNKEESNEILEKFYFSDGELHESKLYKYNEIGNVIENNSNLHGKYSMETTTNYQYNNKGLLIKENSRQTIKEGSIDLNTNYTYNENGDKIKYWFDGSESSKTTYEYVYDSNKNWIKRIEYDDGFPKYLLEREIEYY